MCIRDRRVPAQVELDGLDIREHGLASAYSGFAINDMTGMDMDINENTDLGEDDYEKASKGQIDEMCIRDRMYPDVCRRFSGRYSRWYQDYHSGNACPDSALRTQEPQGYGVL